MSITAFLIGFFLPAMTLISRNVPAYTNDDCKGKFSASMADSGNYGEGWRSCTAPSANSPVWLAYDLSGIDIKKRAKVLLVWYNEDTSPYDHTMITQQESPGYNNPAAYIIQANSSEGGKLPEAGWVKLASIEKNVLHSRQHVVELKGYNWIRLLTYASDGTKDNSGIALNMDIYDASKGVKDDWIFIGDSVTQMSMHHGIFKCKYGKGTFSQLINAEIKDYFPVQENGGTGYMQSTDGAGHIEEWMKIFPGKYVGLAYGTNDAWNGVDPELFYNNYKVMVEAVLKAGKIPMIPKIPWSSAITQIQENGVELNSKIDELYKKYPKIIKGPDYWSFYKLNPSLLSPDGVHPSTPEGLFMYRKLWANTALKDVYRVR
jgi:lysophospholipase L1-like esterase